MQIKDLTDLPAMTRSQIAQVMSAEIEHGEAQDCDHFYFTGEGFPAITPPHKHPVRAVVLETKQPTDLRGEPVEAPEGYPEPGTLRSVVEGEVPFIGY